MVSHPTLVGRLGQLLGPDYVMPLAHHNCIMTKQPEFSSDTLWHQDIRFWSFERKELISVWVALGDENLDNGCLKVIPGTHRMEFEPHRLDDRIFLRPDVPENQALIETSVSAELHPGDILFFHSRTFHAASRNYTDSAKFSVVFTFRPADNPPVSGSLRSAVPRPVVGELLELIIHYTSSITKLVHSVLASIDPPGILTSMCAILCEANRVRAGAGFPGTGRHPGISPRSRSSRDRA